MSIEDIRALLTRASKWSIFVHRNPDGDAIGTALGLANLLKNLRGTSVTVKVFSPSEVAPFLQWLPGFEEFVVVFNSERAKQIADYVAHSDVIVCVDFNEWGRLEEMYESVVPLIEDTRSTSGKPVVVLIDHHEDPRIEADISFWDSRAAAAAQQLWAFICAIGAEEFVDTDCATCIYTAIMTDTGGFRFNSTTSEVHRLAGMLIDKGVKPEEVYTRIYASFTFERLQFFGMAILYRLRYLPEFRTAYMFISSDDMKKFNIGPGDTEGLVNYTLSLKDTVLGALFTERQPGIIRVSLRSRGKLAVNEIASRHFNGGGHKNAAGGVITNMTIEEAESYWLDVLSEYASVLRNK